MSLSFRLLFLGVYLGCNFLQLFATSSPVQLSLTQEKRFFPHQVSSYNQHVNVHIKTGANTVAQSSLPRQLFIVLDTSGSMAGQSKWGNAVSAIENIIQNMNPGDKIHLVQYNSYSSIVFENNDDQKAMLNALHALYPSGGTNLMAGFDVVMPLLKKYSDRSTVNRLFVLSDGQINEGVVDHGQLLATVKNIKNTFDITVCSFGIGYDFDEKLMTNIADYGSGDYFFIKDAKSMEKVVGIAYRGFQNLMGTDAYLKVITKYGTKVLDVYGYDMESNDEQIISIGNLRYNDAMNILLETQVEVTADLLKKDAIEYITVELWMTDVADHAKKLVETGTVQFALSDNEDELKQINEIISNLVQLEKVQRKEDEVTNLLRNGNAEAAFVVQSSIETEKDSYLYRFSTITSTISSEDRQVLEFAESKTKISNRRSETLRKQYLSGEMDASKLAMSSEFNQRLNKKYAPSLQDL